MVRNSLRWDQKDIPHKGWVLCDVIDIDIAENMHNPIGSDLSTCMICGKNDIRYVHILNHHSITGEFKVGCVCSGKLTADYHGARFRERQLKNKLSRHKNWCKKVWKISKKENHYLTIKGHHLLIYRDRVTSRYKCKIDEQFGQENFATLKLAKLAIFEGIEYYKNHGLW